MENHTKERKKMLEQAGISEEVIRFLSELEAPLLYEWSFLCAMEGMSVKDLERIYNEANKQRTQASELFMKEREAFLKKTYENNQDLWKEVQDLLVQVKIMYERAHTLEEGLNGKLTEAIQTKDKAFGEMMQAKDLLIRDRDKQLTAMREELSAMKKEAAGLRDENRVLLEKNAGLKEKVYSLEEQLKKEEIRHPPAVKDNTGEAEKRTPADDPGPGAKVKGTEASQTPVDKVRVFPYSRYGYSVKRYRGRHSFFNRADREANEFIRLYIENKDYNEDQKQYLIECLEQGDSLSVIRKFASPNLSVRYMDQLRRILYERGY